jgi:Zn-dependent protease
LSNAGVFAMMTARRAPAVLLAEPDSTPFDLRFRLFGTPIRVHPLFWLVSVLLGWDLTRNPVLSDNGMPDLMVWVLASFVSILLHEFGHVWMGQVFGTRGHIMLHSMGGLAIGSSDLRSGWQRVLVYAAGPAIQLLLFTVLVAAVLFGVLPFPDRGSAPVFAVFRWLIVNVGITTPEQGADPNPALALFTSLMLTINLLWPLLNLLPILPLDGGQITREICVGASRQNGLLAALWISLGTSAVLAVNALLAQTSGRAFLPFAPTSMWMAIFFALFAVSSWQMIQAEQQNRRSYYNDDRMPWER